MFEDFQQSINGVGNGFNHFRCITIAIENMGVHFWHCAQDVGRSYIFYLIADYSQRPTPRCWKWVLVSQRPFHVLKKGNNEIMCSPLPNVWKMTSRNGVCPDVISSDSVSCIGKMSISCSDPCLYVHIYTYGYTYICIYIEKWCICILVFQKLTISSYPCWCYIACMQ